MTTSMKRFLLSRLIIYRNLNCWIHFPINDLMLINVIGAKSIYKFPLCIILRLIKCSRVGSGLNFNKPITPNILDFQLLTVALLLSSFVSFVLKDPLSKCCEPGFVKVVGHSHTWLDRLDAPFVYKIRKFQLFNYWFFLNFIGIYGGLVKFALFNQLPCSICLLYIV